MRRRHADSMPPSRRPSTFRSSRRTLLRSRREEYELRRWNAAYAAAYEGTEGFRAVEVDDHRTLLMTTRSNADLSPACLDIGRRRWRLRPRWSRTKSA